jgi:hypothetical protein
MQTAEQVMRQTMRNLGRKNLQHLLLAASADCPLFVVWCGRLSFLFNATLKFFE